MRMQRNNNFTNYSISRVGNIGLSVGAGTGHQVKLLRMATHASEATFTTNVGEQSFQISSVSSFPNITPIVKIVNQPLTASEWVEQNRRKLSKHAGKYVAITRAGIVATADNFDDIYSKSKEKGVLNPLVFKVPKASRQMKIVSVKLL